MSRPTDMHREVTRRILSECSEDGGFNVTHCSQILAEHFPDHSEAVRKLHEACKEVLPWVAIATAEIPDRHPQAIENAKEDLARLLAALEETKEFAE